MVAAFPLAKLGVLLVKQVSKPIAAAVSRRAKKSPFFRNYVCIPVAQGFHLFDVKVRMRQGAKFHKREKKSTPRLVFRILNLGKVTKVPKLNEDKAIEEGAQLLSEIVILSIAAGLVTFEYRRSSEKEEAKQVLKSESVTSSWNSKMYETTHVSFYQCHLGGDGKRKV